MLAAGTAERDGKASEAATLICFYAGIHEREHAGEILMRTFLLIEILDPRRVFARKCFEFFLASWIGNASRVENESTAVAGFVFGYALPIGKAANPYHQIFFLGIRGRRGLVSRRVLQLFRGRH